MANGSSRYGFNLAHTATTDVGYKYGDYLYALNLSSLVNYYYPEAEVILDATELQGTRIYINIGYVKYYIYMYDMEFYICLNINLST